MTGDQRSGGEEKRDGNTEFTEGRTQRTQRLEGERKKEKDNAPFETQGKETLRTRRRGTQEKRSCGVGS